MKVYLLYHTKIGYTAAVEHSFFVVVVFIGLSTNPNNRPINRAGSQIRVNLSCSVASYEIVLNLNLTIIY